MNIDNSFFKSILNRIKSSKLQNYLNNMKYGGKISNYRVNI